MLALTQATGVSSFEPRSLRWLVTNGDSTIGPVHTELLQRGYLGGRIPEHCQVREVSWNAWRPLHGIRELGTLKRRLERDCEAPLDLREASHRLPQAAAEGELLSCALQLAAQAMGASVGLMHRYRSPARLPVASSTIGVPERLGEVLPETDPVFQLALRGRGLCGSPQSGLAERLLAERLQYGAPLVSVAMTPVVVHGRLLALLELGRTEHAFRGDDAENLSEFAAAVALRLG